MRRSWFGPFSVFWCGNPTWDNYSVKFESRLTGFIPLGKTFHLLRAIPEDRETRKKEGFGCFTRVKSSVDKPFNVQPRLHEKLYIATRYTALQICGCRIFNLVIFKRHT